MTVEHSQQQTILLPRALIFLSCLWLIGSWSLAMGFRTPVHPSAASFTPGVRMMIMCVTIGLMIGWPLLRLSQASTPFPGRQTMLDLIVLLSLVQVVLWPLRLVTVWSPLRTAAIDAAIIGWLLLIGAIVAAAIGTARAGPRNIAMLACLGVSLLGPLTSWIGLTAGVRWTTPVGLSPLLAVHELGGGGGARPTSAQWLSIWIVFAAAIAAWVALAMFLRRPRRALSAGRPPPTASGTKVRATSHHASHTTTRPSSGR